MIRGIVLNILLVTVVTIGYGQKPDRNDIFHLYLIGDAGEPESQNTLYKELVRIQRSENSGVASALIFLGDNVYPKGMPDNESKSRGEAEEILMSQIRIGESIDRTIFIPGNHDWKKGRFHGLSQLKNQQQWFDSLSNTHVEFLPKNGCPGPIEVALSPDLVVIILDSQWWVHPWDKPEGDNSLCDEKNPDDIIAAVRDIFQRNKGKQIVIAAHHPIYTYGPHGGVFTWRDHIFPFTAFKESKWYIPLPVIGSIYPLYRKFFGSLQDVAHPAYKLYAENLEQLMMQYPGTIHAAGHEHNLQYSFKDSVHYIVSGAGSKENQVKQKGYSQYVKSELGFVRLAITQDHITRIEYFADSSKTPEFTVVQKIKSYPNENLSDLPQDSVIITEASKQYNATDSKEKWLGKNYRDEWSQPIEAAVFNFEANGKSLNIVQRGGGMQTLSLRLEDSDGKQYTLRSIEKYPEKAIPEAFRRTFAKEIVQDQISAAHPYGAIVIPYLANAIGIYHTNPQIVWLGNDKRLGEYHQDFANRLMLFEERPSGSAKGMEFFGSADDIVSTVKVIEQLQKDNDNYVDQSFVLRSRLFDLWIGDWDRHDDQWRWAEFDKKKGKMYRPIPRDRDQAFFVNEGRIPKMFSKKWALPKFQGFDYELKWPSGFMYNARYFDRSFLTELEADRWMKEAKELQAILTDEVIETAIKKWPTVIYVLHGKEIVAKLKSRREKLLMYAMDHYRFLAEEVDVVGSDKHELFKAQYDSLGNVKVEVFKLNKEGEVDKEIYSRSFTAGETKEVRLYGLDGNDRFEVTGEKRSSIKIRAIGGKGEDSISSTAPRKSWIYDKPKGMRVQARSKIVNRRSADPRVNEYNRKSFRYDLLAPLAYFNYNVDDGIFIGGGALRITHGFRKDPFKQSHLFLGSYAINTSSFNFKYDGKFTGVFGKWNLEIDADIKSPNFVNNFFGLGNESIFNKDIDEDPSIDVEHPIDYYRLRFEEWTLDIQLTRVLGKIGFIKIGPSFQWVELEKNDDDRYVKDYEATLTEEILEVDHSFAGLSGTVGVDLRNDKKITTKGLYLEYHSQWMKELRSSSHDSYGSNTISLAFYQSFRFPAKVTFAFRASGGMNSGRYQIFQYQQLDGKTEVRGFRKTRFYGDSELFFNNEVRIRLGRIRSYILPGTIGLLAFYDLGRVWYEDENGIDPTSVSGKSTVWHKGYGGGVWFAPFDLAIISTEVAGSREGVLFNIRLGFLF